MSVNVPDEAVESADRVSALLPLPGAGMLDRAQVAETPAGSPDAENDIDELKPAPGAVVKVIGSEPPGPRLPLVALDDSVKTGKTVKLNVWVLVTPPPDAVTVTA